MLVNIDYISFLKLLKSTLCLVLTSILFPKRTCLMFIRQTKKRKPLFYRFLLIILLITTFIHADYAPTADIIGFAKSLTGMLPPPANNIGAMTISLFWPQAGGADSTKIAIQKINGQLDNVLLGQQNVIDKINEKLQLDNLNQLDAQFQYVLDEVNTTYIPFLGTGTPDTSSFGIITPDILRPSTAELDDNTISPLITEQSKNIQSFQSVINDTTVGAVAQYGLLTSLNISLMQERIQLYSYEYYSGSLSSNDLRKSKIASYTSSCIAKINSYIQCLDSSKADLLVNGLKRISTIATTTGYYPKTVTFGDEFYDCSGPSDVNHNSQLITPHTHDTYPIYSFNDSLGNKATTPPSLKGYILAIDNVTITARRDSVISAATIEINSVVDNIIDSLTAFFEGAKQKTIEMQDKNLEFTPISSDITISLTKNDTNYAFNSSQFEFHSYPVDPDSLTKIRICAIPNPLELYLDINDNGTNDPDELVQVNDSIDIDMIHFLKYIPSILDSTCTEYEGSCIPAASFTFEVKGKKLYSKTYNCYFKVKHEHPTSLDISKTLLEDGMITFTHTDFVFNDSTIGDTLVKIKILSTTTKGQLFLDANRNGMYDAPDETLSANQEILIDQLSTLTFKPVPDSSGAPYTTFTFKVSDGTYFSKTYTSTINVNAVFDNIKITSDSITSFFHGDQYYYEAIVKQGDNINPVIIKYENLPSWIGVDIFSGGWNVIGHPTSLSVDTSFTLIADNGGVPDTIQVIVKLVPDTIKIISSALVSAVEDIKFSYDATAVGRYTTLGLSSTINFSNLPSWLTINGNTVSGIPVNGIADTSFIVTASAGLSTDEITVSVTVTSINDSPFVKSPLADTTTTVGSVFNYQISSNTFNDIDDNNLTISVKGLPSGLAFTESNNTISGIPTDIGSNSVIVTATDLGLLSVTDTFIISVIAAIDTFNLSYTAGANGTIAGETTQKVQSKSDGTKVTAIPDANCYFVEWSDGVLTAERTDLSVEANISVTALFDISTAITEGGILDTKFYGIAVETNPISIYDSEVNIVVGVGEKGAIVKMVIFDNLGNLIDEQEGYTNVDGAYRFIWDLQNHQGNRVSYGTYIVMAMITANNGRTMKCSTLLGVKQ